MGMTIDESKDILINRLMPCLKNTEWGKALEVAIDTMRRYQMMGLDYNARLRADIAAMLTDIQLEIEKHGDAEYHADEYNDGYNDGVKDMAQIVEQKINALKGNDNE